MPVSGARLPKMKKLVLKSPAKINLYLEVVNRRRDGYHNIRTLFERISLCDKITLTNLPQSRIEVECVNRRVPLGKDNLAFRAAALLKKDFAPVGGVRIKIDKCIPLAAGLGGGSSNAAFTLLGLNRFWGLKLDKKHLIRYARRIGADVAFFILEEPFALGKERGDVLVPIEAKKTLWHVLAVPNLAVSTKKVYEGYGQDLRLTKPRFNNKILHYILNKGEVSRLKPLVYNDLEKVIFHKHKVIPEIVDWLKKYSIAAGMSGSGPAVFGVFKSRCRAERTAKDLKRYFCSLRVFTVRTY